MYRFSDEDISKIIDQFGSQFFNRVKSLIEPVVKRWGISDLIKIQSFSANLVFKGFSTIYGSIILKFANNREEFNSELSALTLLKRDAVCKLHNYDRDNFVLLLESIEPGDTLYSEDSLMKRLEIFCDLFKKLHLKDLESCDYNFDYLTYEDWVVRISNYMRELDGWEEISNHMLEAEKLLLDIKSIYPDTTLLHGDFHYYNILKQGDRYKIIDPKGVKGNPVFDIPRYIINEYWDEKDRSKVDNKMSIVFSTISDKLGLSKNLLYKLSYIEVSMANCWGVEDGAALDDKGKILEQLEWFYNLIDFNNV